MNTRQKWIDQARGVALLFVVIGHMGIPYIGQFFTTVHLPLFFFLSGLTFSTKSDFGTFVKGKVRRLLIPYVCLGVPLLMSSFLPRITSGVTDISVYTGLLLDFFVQRRLYTIWFLPCLFLASLILYGFIKLTKERTGRIIAAAAALGTLCILYWEMGGAALPWNIDAAFLAVTFMALGYWSKKTGWINKEKNFRSWIVFFLAGLVYVVGVGFNGFVFGEKFDMAMCQSGFAPVSLMAILAGIYCIVFLLKHFSLGSVFDYLGENTMVYFAWHQSIVLPLLLELYNRFGWFTADTLLSDGVRSILTVVLIFLILWPVDVLFRKTKFRVVIGK